jgi:hypothetical protein
MDAPRSGGVHKGVTGWAGRHAARHTDAQDVLDGREPGGGHLITTGEPT